MQLRKLEADPAKAEALLRSALELGVDHIDTAQFYGNGFVNRMIRTVQPEDGGVVVASKVGGVHDPKGKIPVKPAQRPHELRTSVEDNLISLGMEQIPLVNLRRSDFGPGVPFEGDQIVDIDDQMAEMIAMRDEGKIGSIGLSGISLEKLTRVLSADIACVQNAYSLVSRECENLISVCLDHGIAWVPFFPLGGAVPGWPKVTDQSKVIDIAKQLSITPSQVGLAWLLRHGENTLLIPGTADVGHLEENLTSASVVLDEQAMTALNDLETRR
jgi:aryl-alcohol dehydrogenase-like predicted oxidoreductase